MLVLYCKWCEAPLRLCVIKLIFFVHKTVTVGHTLAYLGSKELSAYFLSVYVLLCYALERLNFLPLFFFPLKILCCRNVLGF